MSEYHYEESIDEERTRNLLSFGDDYRSIDFFKALKTKKKRGSDDL